MSNKSPIKRERDPAATRQRLIDATVRLMLQQGFSGTSVDQICKEAGMTKGGFFHHFENKEALGTAAVEWWGRMGTALYAEAWQTPRSIPWNSCTACLTSWLASPAAMTIPWSAWWE